jgi:hypothetical protein
VDWLYAGWQEIKATLAGEALEGSVARGSPQEDILLPLLCSLVVDELIRELNKNGCYTLGYADDTVTIIHRKFLNTTSELLQDALSMVQQWCDRTQPSMNPQKMVIIPSTQKRYLRRLKESTLSGYTLQLSTKVKYLGLNLGKGLTWKTQTKNLMTKADGAFWTCKGTCGKTWGLKPRVVHWIYTMVVRPILTYDSRLGLRVRKMSAGQSSASYRNQLV